MLDYLSCRAIHIPTRRPLDQVWIKNRLPADKQLGYPIFGNMETSIYIYIQLYMTPKFGKTAAGYGVFPPWFHVSVQATSGILRKSQRDQDLLEEFDASAEKSTRLATVYGC